MPPASRLGDMNTGEPCFPPTVCIAGSPDVCVNGLPAVRLGDSYGVHNCGIVVHPTAAGKGSATVFINNLPAVRQGDVMICNPINFAHLGSPDTMFGD